MRPYYEQDGITIYHGDCREVLPQVDSPDLVIADPPYGMGQSAQHREKRAKHDPGSSGAFPTMVGDFDRFDPSHLLVYPRLILFGANHFADALPASGSWIVWDKRNGAPPDNNADAELAWTNLGGAVRMYRQCWRGFTRERDSLEMTEKHLHPTQKPVLLMEWLIDRYTEPGDLIVDPYMGSGPVMRAAKNLGRQAIGIEIEERYCEIAAKRLMQSVMVLA